MTHPAPTVGPALLGGSAAATTATDLLADAIVTIRDAVGATVQGLTAEQLAFRPSPTSNSIAWLIWHLTRVQDAQVAGAFDREQVWTSGDWTARFALPFDSGVTGSGQAPEDAATVWVESGELLTGYHRAVSRRTLHALTELTDAELARVVDGQRVPPTTLGLRLTRVVHDDLQHLGQAAYVRGLLGHGPY